MSASEVKPLQKSRSRARFQILIIGALLGVSVFLFEAGIAEIMLAEDVQCRQGFSDYRLRPDPVNFCMPEWQTLMLGSASLGVVGLFFPTVAQAVAWLLMGALYAGLGAACSQLQDKWSVFVFAFLNILLIALVAGLGYLSQYIA
jgi:hypothetical protein